MKKKSVFLSKVFAVALAASLAFSAPYASAAKAGEQIQVTESATYEGDGYLVGNGSQTADAWTYYSEQYVLSGDFDVTFDIVCKSGGLQNWHTILPRLYDKNGKFYMTMRVDNWCWSDNENATNEGTEVLRESNWNWDTFKTDIMDMKITLNAVRTGDHFVFKMAIVTADGADHFQNYTFDTKAENEVIIDFSTEKADSYIKSFKINGGGAAGDTPDNTDTTPAPTDTPDNTDTTPAPTDTPDNADTTPAPTTPDNTDTTPAPTDTPDNTDTTPDNTEDETDTEKSEEETATSKAAKLNKTKATVKVGKSVKLKVKNTTKAVTWSTSNKKVAKVSKAGKVTGVKAGKATIKAKVGGKTLKCKVTVK